jgi:subtilisin family serine protease
MKNKKLTVVFIALLVLSCFNSFVVYAFASPPQFRRVIIGFKGPPSEALIQGLGGKIIYSYHVIPAIACFLPPQAIEALARNPQIDYIDEDIAVSILGKPDKPPSPDKPSRRKGYLVTRAFLDDVEINIPYEVNGDERGITPNTLVLKPKSYTVTATYNGETKQESAEVIATQTTIVEFRFVSPPPPPEQGTLQITTTPVNGEVFIDDISQGLAPVTKDVDVGSYTVSFGDVSGSTTPAPQAVDVYENQTTFVEGIYQLIPPPPVQGTLQITTTPVTGEIFIDGISEGPAPVIKVVDIDSYTISFGDVAEYITPAPQIVDVYENQTTSVEGVYEPVPPPPPYIPWGIDRIDADLAWNTSTGVNIQVAVLDTGIDKNHPDLQDNILAGISFVYNWLGPPFWNPNAWDDDMGHGTWCAGIIKGIAPDVDLVAVKVMDATGYGYTSDVIAGIEWCMDNVIDVISMSFVDPVYSNAFHNILNAAYIQGIVLVGASGNDGDGNPATNEVMYPAKYDAVMAVAGIDENDIVAPFSSDGAEVEITGPAVNINSTWMGGGYAVHDGTSGSCPHVSGTAALIMSLDITLPQFAGYDGNSNGAWDSWEVRNRLRYTADDLGDAGRDVFYGFGLVDAQEAVTGVETLP